MPREYAKNWFSTWSDDDFCTQPIFDKLFYVVLCGQRGVNNAGVLAINFPRWRKAMRDGDRVPTERELKESLRRMEKRRTVFVDEDAGELLIRSHMRRDELDKQPNILLSGLRFLATFDSAKFARVMLAELDRIEIPIINSEKPYAKQLRANLAAAAEGARTHLATLSEGLSEDYPEPFAEDFPEPFRSPAETSNQREGLPEGSREPPVVVEVEVEVASFSGGYVSNERKEPPYPPNDEPVAPEHLPARTNGGGLTPKQLAVQLNKSARSVTAYKIAEDFSRSSPVPIQRDVLTEFGQQIDKCLKDRIPPETIAEGMHLWAKSNSWSPTQIPHFVAKAAMQSVAAPVSNGRGKPTESALDYQASAERLIAALENP